MIGIFLLLAKMNESTPYTLKITAYSNIFFSILIVASWKARLKTEIYDTCNPRQDSSLYNFINRFSVSVGVSNRIRDSEGGEFTEAGRMDFGEICRRWQFPAVAVLRA